LFCGNIGFVFFQPSAFAAMPDQTETPYEKNTRLQYEALGRFVEQFEMMVNEVREISLERLLEGLDDHQKGGLIEIAFHHSVMTAKPLFDIMRAILADALNIPAHPHYKDRAIFKEVLGHIEKEYSFLYNKRNDLLHGTWFIGYYYSQDPEAAEFILQRYKTSADGLIRAKKLPKNAHELLSLADRCSEVRTWLAQIEICFTHAKVNISEIFEKNGKEWLLATRMTTLPKK
jgi:hypothetical protein